MLGSVVRIRRGVSAAVLVVGMLGVGVVTSAPAGATLVSTEAQLRAAFAADASVELANDITLIDCTGGGAVERTTTDPVVLDGQGHTLTQTCADNAVVQETASAGLMTVRNITITGGDASGSGGAIFAQGDLTVVNSTLRDNHANDFGGGLATLGILQLDTTLVDHNNAAQGGGGIAADLQATLTNSTVSNNLGGGVTTLPDPQANLLVVNSTITKNSAAGQGGGISNGGLTTLVYATITDNSALNAFGSIFSQQLQTFGSVVTGGTVAGSPSNCLGGGSVSNGYNYSDDDSCNFTQSTDRENAPPPGLGALAANGGPTPTQLPDTGSPLIDTIPVAACQADGAAGITTDQRGVTRPQAGGCDIGAVEVVPAITLQPTFTG